MPLALPEAAQLLMQYVQSKAPSGPADLVQDSFYNDFREGKTPADLPVVEQVIANIKGSAQKQL